MTLSKRQRASLGLEKKTPLFNGKTLDELHIEALIMDASINDARKSWAIIRELRIKEGWIKE